jgi:hypothetical protein
MQQQARPALRPASASSLAPLKFRSQMPDPLKLTAAGPWEVVATPAPVPYATSKPSSGIPKPLRGRPPAALIMLGQAPEPGVRADRRFGAR